MAPEDSTSINSEMAQRGLNHIESILMHEVSRRFSDILFGDLLRPRIDLVRLGNIASDCSSNCHGNCSGACSGSCGGGCGKKCEGDCTGSCSGDCSGTAKGAKGIFDDPIARLLADIMGQSAQAVNEVLNRHGFGRPSGVRPTD